MPLYNVEILVSSEVKIWDKTTMVNNSINKRENSIKNSDVFKAQKKDKNEVTINKKKLNKL